MVSLQSLVDKVLVDLPVTHPSIKMTHAVDLLENGHKAHDKM
eukprot:COSAG02_NODE_1641_length_11530_cov_4.345289_13_plen_42_part_00